MKIAFNMFDGTSAEYSVKSKSFVIGRSKKCDISISLEGFSREHCRIDIEQDEIFLTDLGSRNGVFIAGKKLKPGIKTRYNLYQELAIGYAHEVILKMEDFDLSPLVIAEKHLLDEMEGPEKKIIPRKKVAKPPKVVPFSVKLASVLKPIGTIALLAICYYSYSHLKGMFNSNTQDEELYKLEYEAHMKNRHKDGSVKTTDF